MNLNPKESKSLAMLAKRTKSKDNKFFIAVELAIYEGVMKVAKADNFPIIPYRDSWEELGSNIQFLNITQDKNETIPQPQVNGDKKHNLSLTTNELLYYQLERDSKLAINIWCIDMDKKAFCLGSAGITLFSENGYLKQKDHNVYMWPFVKYNEELICFGNNRIGHK
jgi:hypothetical protein